MVWILLVVSHWCEIPARQVLDAETKLLHLHLSFSGQLYQVGDQEDTAAPDFILVI